MVIAIQKLQVIRVCLFVKHTLTGNSREFLSLRSWIVEFSDPVLGDYFGADGVINLRVGGQTCQLRESDDRSFICEMGEFGGQCDFTALPSHHVITDQLRCAQGRPSTSPPSPTSSSGTTTSTSSTSPPTTTTTTTTTTTATTATTATTTTTTTSLTGASTVSTTSAATSTRPAPVIFPPIEGGSANWAFHLGLNCWEEHGAVSLPDSNPLLGTYTVEECRQQCEMNPDCEAAVIATHVSTPKFPCFLRTNVEITQCRSYADFDVWEIQRAPSTTSLSSTTSTSVTSTGLTSPD